MVKKCNFLLKIVKNGQKINYEYNCNSLIFRTIDHDFSFVVKFAFIPMSSVV